MRIVLVNPSRTTRLIVTRMLEARGHAVLPFANELEALAVIKGDLSIDGLITSAELAQCPASSCAGRRGCSPPAAGPSTS
jgi:hypothetical protein